MGNEILMNNPCCTSCKPQPQEADTPSKSYDAMSDKFIMPVEQHYNLLTKIRFNDYINALIQLNQTSMLLSIQHHSKNQSNINITPSKINESVTEEMLTSFIDNRIIPNDSLYEYNQDRQSRILSIFKDLLLETYKDLKKNFYIYSEDKYDIIKKYHFIAMGMVYCKGRHKDKLELIFQMFKNENNRIYKNQEMNKFLVSCFLIPSCCQVFARMKLATKYPFLGDINKEDMLAILDAFELKDMERLTKIFNGFLFKENMELTLNEFIEAFYASQLEWLFSSSGIRFYLEKYNDVKDSAKTTKAVVERKQEDTSSTNENYDNLTLEMN